MRNFQGLLLSLVVCFSAVVFVGCNRDPVSPARVLAPVAEYAEGDSICYPDLAADHPCTAAAANALLTMLRDEAARLKYTPDSNCTKMGGQLQSFVDRGAQGVRVWSQPYYYQGNTVVGDYHTNHPNEIHLWSEGGDLTGTARHETAHAMQRDDYGPGDPDPSIHYAGNSNTMGAYALSDYCGSLQPVI